MPFLKSISLKKKKRKAMPRRKQTAKIFKKEKSDKHGEKKIMPPVP